MCDITICVRRPLTRRKNATWIPLLSRAVVSAFLKPAGLVVTPRMYRFSFGQEERIIARGISTIRAISQGTEITSDRSGIESGTSESMSTTKQFSARIIWQASNLARLISLGSAHLAQCNFGNRNRSEPDLDFLRIIIFPILRSI